MAWQAATHTGNGHALAKELFAVKGVASEHCGPGGGKISGRGRINRALPLALFFGVILRGER